MLKIIGADLAGQDLAGAGELEELAREGARRMLEAALEVEVAAYLEWHQEERDRRGHALVVRNGRARARKVTLGAGTVELHASARPSGA